MAKEITSIYGYEQLISLATATNINPPPRDVNGFVCSPSTAIIIPEDAPVRWRDDGIDPTPSVGMLLSPGTIFSYDGDLKRIKFIQQSAAAKLNVSYYK
jgi:hypothetical protein